jgi:hypothetical protein
MRRTRHLEIHNDTIERLTRSGPVRLRNLSNFLKSFQTITSHYPLIRGPLHWGALTLSSQSNMFQLPHQNSLINQIILHNQDMWFWACYSLGRISLFQSRAGSITRSIIDATATL